jgi:hypothetical protein
MPANKIRRKWHTGHITKALQMVLITLPGKVEG